MRTYRQERSKLQWKRTSDEGDGLAIHYANHPIALAIKPRTEPPRSTKERETTEHLAMGARKGY